MGIHKKFSQELYEKNDAPAVEAVLTHLFQQGSYAGQNEDKYGPDIILFSGYKKLSYVEVEIKHNWHAGVDKFPYSTVHLPERKGRYLRLRHPIEYWILRADLQAAIIIPDFTLSSSLLEEVPNSLVSSGERFYCVPLEQCIHKEL